MRVTSRMGQNRRAVILGGTILVLWIGILPLSGQAQDFVPQRSWVPGDTVRFGIGKHVALLSKHHGWFLWERATPAGKECMAFKVADGFPWPRFSELGRLTGSAGYWLSWDSISDFQWGEFFGRHYWPRLQVAEVDGEVRTDYYSFDAVASWDGEIARFEITTTPYQHLWVDRHEDSGVIDFTGVRAIMDEFAACKSRLRES